MAMRDLPALSAIARFDTVSRDEPAQRSGDAALSRRAG